MLAWALNLGFAGSAGAPPPAQIISPEIAGGAVPGTLGKKPGSFEDPGEYQGPRLYPRPTEPVTSPYLGGDRPHRTGPGNVIGANVAIPTGESGEPDLKLLVVAFVLMRMI